MNTKKHYVVTSIMAAISILFMIISMSVLPSPLFQEAHAVTSNQPVMMQAGHADFGPTLSGGKWKIQIRDDTGDDPVWRDPENVVFRLGNSSIVPMPDDSTYAFIGEKPGTKLYVIPQTQNQDVVWLGWNTQEGGVLNELDRGANLSLDGVSGPGKLHVYLENGNKHPQQLWDSTKGYPQNTWIETNAHTHVNWVFSKPGVYHVKLTFSGKLKNGRKVSDTRLLNFAVGENTNPQDALATSSTSGKSSSQNNNENEEDTDENESEDDSDDRINEPDEAYSKDNKNSSKRNRKHNKKDDTSLVIAQMVTVTFVLLLIIVIIFLVIAVVKTRKAKKLAIEQRLKSRANNSGETVDSSNSVDSSTSSSSVDSSNSSEVSSNSSIDEQIQETSILPR